MQRPLATVGTYGVQADLGAAVTVRLVAVREEDQIVRSESGARNLRASTAARGAHGGDRLGITTIGRNE